MNKRSFKRSFYFPVVDSQLYVMFIYVYFQMLARWEGAQVFSGDYVSCKVKFSPDWTVKKKYLSLSWSSEFNYIAVS